MVNTINKSSNPVTKDKAKRVKKNKPILNSKLEAVSMMYIDRLFENTLYNTLPLIHKMMVEDNASSLAYESLCLLITSMMRDYTNTSNTAIQDEIRKNLAQFSGSITTKFLEACNMFLYGFSFAELEHSFDDNGKATLKHINFLRQDLIEFDDRFQTEEVTFIGDRGDVVLQYSLCFHLVNQSNISPGKNPKGHRLADRALAYWDLDRILLASYAVVAQRQSTKLLVGKTDTSAMVDTGVTDVDGNPIERYSSDVMLESLIATKDSSVMVVDTADDVIVVDQEHDGKFFLNGLHYAAEERFRSFYHSMTMYANSQSGLGDAGLAEFQQKNVLSIAAAKAQYMAREFVEQVIKPIIIFNHGEQEDYGSIPIDIQDTKALETATLIGNVLDKLSDPEQKKAAVERLLKLTGISG